MAAERNKRDTLEDVAECVVVGLNHVGETGFGEIVIKCKLYRKGLMQVDVNRGTTYRFYIQIEEVLGDTAMRRR